LTSQHQTMLHSRPSSVPGLSITPSST
jgi:hypothetical protein